LNEVSSQNIAKRAIVIFRVDLHPRAGFALEASSFGYLSGRVERWQSLKEELKIPKKDLTKKILEKIGMEGLQSFSEDIGANSHKCRTIFDR
jgi:hypothetical protein